MKIKSSKIVHYASIIFPAFFVMYFMMVFYYQNRMYPFGTRSLSWCDMSQQVVPLLNQFKDILDGKSGFFLNMKNSGGMNFFGVFFFFLASPFTFLVKFVDKADMMMFANVLVALKMSVAAFTASLCFTLCRKKLDPFSVMLLSVMYPLSGYAMMYFQNIIWLDMMYLFPLLMIALDRITRRQKPLMYIFVLSAMVVVNYYISYMVVIFILLFTVVYILGAHSHEFCSRVCRDILVGSAISALLTAVVWLPSLLQYFSSGRGETTIVDSIVGSDFITNFFTILPMLFCSAFAIVITVTDIAVRGDHSARNKRLILLLGLTLIPMFIEPVNKMWHTGNYMSFPCRFGFITIFFMLFCAAYSLEKPVDFKKNLPVNIVALAVCGVAAALAFYYMNTLADKKKEEISRFSRTLWGDQESFKWLISVFLIVLAIYGAAHFFYRKGFMHKTVFLSFCAIVFVGESFFSSGVYIGYPAMHNEEINKSQSEAYDLADRIDDDDFYRVKSYAKFYNNNMIGALGYDTISHYTSLNDRNFMFTMKRLGYSGVWMETLAVDGTRLTDAMLSIKYEINGGCDGSSIIYQSKAGRIEHLPNYLPMGLLTDKGSMDGKEDLPDELDRIGVQQYLSEALLGENLVTRYEPTGELTKKDGKYTFHTGDTVTYEFDVDGTCALYADCFDELTNHLSEPIFDAFDISVNSSVTRTNYPNSSNNGLYCLGDFKNESVKVTFKCKKDITCASFGLMSIDTARLKELCKSAQGVGLTDVNNGMKGSCKLDKAQTCFVSLPYSDNYTIKVNGKMVDYSRALSGFISFDLKKGNNDIEISFIPKGFAAGAAISSIGLAALAAYIVFRKKLEKPLKCDNAAKFIMLAVSAFAALVVYIVPIVIYIVKITTKFQ